MYAEEHHEATGDLDQIGDEHHLAFGVGVGKGTDKRCQHDIRENEEQLQHRRHPLGRLQRSQKRDRNDQQCVISERRKKLRRHDGVEAAIHAADVLL